MVDRLGVMTEKHSVGEWAVSSARLPAANSDRHSAFCLANQSVVLKATLKADNLAVPTDCYLAARKEGHWAGQRGRERAGYLADLLVTETAEMTDDYWVVHWGSLKVALKDQLWVVSTETCSAATWAAAKAIHSADSQGLRLVGLTDFAWALNAVAQMDTLTVLH
eukprot:gene47315-biopygen8895